MRNTLGYTGSVRRWNNAAIYCYKRGCNCNGCQITDIIKNLESVKKCQMKATVLELVRRFGIP